MKNWDRFTMYKCEGAKNNNDKGRKEGNRGREWLYINLIIIILKIILCDDEEASSVIGFTKDGREMIKFYC